jgi:hypothetical protein
MDIQEVLKMLDGAGIIITDWELVEETLEEWCIKLDDHFIFDEKETNDN